MEEKTSQNKLISPSSFRDPSGSVFTLTGVIYRQVNQCYQQHYDLLMQSGLYDNLVKEGLLIDHEELPLEKRLTDEAYKVIKPCNIPFISYPYEWSFSQLKDAALTTLKAQKMALDYGMGLKDASAYNIQYFNGKPVLMDTLSFQVYQEGTPWVAYKQFCQHFLAPLALMVYKDIRLGQLLRTYIDGIPLDLVDKLLPSTSFFRPHLLMHIHLHAKSQRKYAGKNIIGDVKIKRASLLGLIDSLESAIKALQWNPNESQWMSYYEKDTNYTAAGFAHKKQLVEAYVKQIIPKTVWDLGANTGVFSRLAGKDALTVSWDADPACVEMHYRECRKKGDINILPLLMDLTNPSSAIGWAHEERKSVAERGPADMLLALALVHHLTIANNIPFNSIAKYLSRIGKHLIIEFIPKTDSQVQRLLMNRQDIFSGYTRDDFEMEFKRYFQIHDACEIRDSLRTVYRMERISF